jgi:hypothetical protein
MVTPTLLIEFFSYTASGLLEKEMVARYSQTLITLVVNTLFIPFVIENLSYVEGFETKQDRHVAVMNRNFFFMIIFTLFMPIMGFTSLNKFFSEISQSKVVDMPALVSNNLLNQYDYFVIYFIQITFISMGMQAIDITHYVAGTMF